MKDNFNCITFAEYDTRYIVECKDNDNNTKAICITDEQTTRQLIKSKYNYNVGVLNVKEKNNIC